MNRVVVITGVSSGIGLQLAKKFIESGDKVYGLSRHKFELEGLNHIVCDVSFSDECENAIEKIVELEGKIDLLINNAGMGIAGSVENTSEADARRIFDVNFFGTFYMCKHALKYLRESKGRIVNISSVASKLSIPYQAFYSASKASIDAISAGIRAEAKQFGVKVITILPGDTKTGFTAARVKHDDGVYDKNFKKSIEKMEKDEQNGMSSEYVAKIIFKAANKKHPPIFKIVGVQYKIFLCLAKILPARFVEWVISKLYS